MALTEQEYCTLDDVKAELGISGSSEDTYLESLIKAASRRIDNYCNRTFWYQSAATHKFAFSQDIRHFVPLTPVISITSITDSDSVVTFTSGTDYELEDAESGAIFFEKMASDTFWRRRGVVGDPDKYSRKKRFVVTYEGGYETDEQSATGADALPEDIRRVCVSLVTDYYRNKGSNPRVKRRHLLEAAVWFDNGYTDEVLFETLKRYKRLVQS